MDGEDGGLGGLGDDGDQAASSDGEDDAGGLVVRLEEDKAGVPKSGDAAAAQWFSQDIFEQAGVGADAGSSEDEDEQTPYELAGDGRVRLPDLDLDDDMDKGEEDSDAEPSMPDAEAVYGAGRSGGAAAPGLARASAEDRPDDDFEVVPQGGGDAESESEDELDALDNDAKAELMALAKKMLRRKVKDNIVEAAYNRYAFHDTNLPKWFEDDEIKHMRPIPQVTADELQAAKDELKAVDARPIKKVAEAKARKKARLARKLAQARQKAEAVANQGDASTKQKMREIEKIYNDVHRSSRGKKSKKGGRDADRKRKGPPLDARMRKDKRGEERASKKRGGKAGRGRGGRR
ncbi:Spb1 C-terminal domain-containing protein [Helicosporidium sp. ATCC 50920]|nr:Spb1 C-terminal domain-containing protein [Helicosporidium sp. ATCC 50920]|eukprot:KDD73562.1 Spb1 C-terminal domain-containing protein [Helicosporidium sp. ATCC 50920]